MTSLDMDGTLNFDWDSLGGHIYNLIDGVR